MCDSWKLRYGNTIKLNEAEYNPNSDANTKIPLQPKYIRLTTKDSGVCLKLKRKDSGEGCEIFVNPNSTNIVENTFGIKFIECSELEYYRYVVRKNDEQNLVFWGLLIGVAGLVIDALFDLGKIYAPFGYWSANYIFFGKAVSWTFKIVGLCLVFWKGLSTGK